MNIAQLAPLLGGTGGIGTALGVYLSRRQGRKEKAVTDALVKDEILGHRGIQGVPDKRGLSERLGMLELGLGGIQRELYPDGNGSLGTKIIDTHRLAEQAAIAAADAAAKVDQRALDWEHLAEEVRAHARLDEEHWRIITDHFIESPKGDT